MKSNFIIILFTITSVLFISCGVQNDLIKPSDIVTKEVKKESNGRVNFFKYKKGIDKNSINATREWWKKFNDKNLNLIVENTLKYNNNIIQYGEKIKDAKANLQASKSLARPTLSYNGGYHYNGVSIPSSTVAGSADKQIGLVGLSSGWEIDLWKRIRYIIGSSKAIVKASQHSLNAMKLSISAEVVSSYFQLVSLNRQIEFLIEARDDLVKSLKIEKKRLDIGQSTLLNYNSIVANKQSVEAQLPNLYLARYKAIYSIKVLQGSTSKLLTYDDNKYKSFNRFPKILKIDKNISLSLALSRPDVCSAEQIVRANDSNWRATKRSYLPKINLSLSGIIGDIISKPYFLFFDLAGSISGPIYDGGYIDSQIKLALNSKKIAMLNYKATINTAIEDIKLSINSYDNNTLLYLLTNKEILAYTNLYNITQQQYKYGDSSIYDLLNIRINLLIQKLNLINAKFNQFNSIVNYYKSIGGGYNYACL